MQSVHAPEFRSQDAQLSLACIECDARTQLPDCGHALAEGWSEIDYAPNVPNANCIGLCPDCREKFENWPTSEI